MKLRNLPLILRLPLMVAWEIKNYYQLKRWYKEEMKWWYNAPKFNYAIWRDYNAIK